MRRALFLLAAVAALSCKDRSRSPGEADTLGQVGNDSILMDQNIPGQNLRVSGNPHYAESDTARYEALGTAPQADTGTAVGEYSDESGGSELYDDSVATAVQPAADTAPRLMGARRPRPTRNKPPLASFTAGCTGLKCVYRSTSRDPDGSVVKTLWSFPNGDAFNTLQVTRTYNQAGTYRVTLTVVDNLGAKDDTTRKVSVTGVVDTTVLPPPPPTTDTTPPPPDTTIVRGKPLGGYNFLDAAQLAPFNVVHVGSTARSLINRIDDARTRGYKLILALPSPMSHNPSNWREGCCLRPINGVLQFSQAGFDSAMKTYNTPEIRSAVQKAYADGVVLGINTMDEPWVKGLGDGNTWGPEGTMTKARVDSLCATHHRVFPGVPVGPSDSHIHWEPNNNLKVCDIGLEQYSYRYGTLSTWLSGAEAVANRGKYKHIYSFNNVNGGTQDRDGTWDCKDQGGVKGQASPNCAMTAAQIVAVVKGIGGAGCGATITWRYDEVLFARTELKAGWSQAATAAKTFFVTPCRPRS